LLTLALRWRKYGLLGTGADFFCMRSGAGTSRSSRPVRAAPFVPKEHLWPFHVWTRL